MLNATRVMGKAGGAALQWRPVTVPALSVGYAVKIVYGNGRWGMVAYSPGVNAHLTFASTDDGETWSQGDFTPLFGFGSPYIEYLPAAGLFVCIGTGGVIFTSPDFLVWTWYASPNSDVSAMTYMGVFQNKLLAASTSKSARTTDGFSWTGVVTLPPNPSGGSYDGTSPLASGPSRALYTPNSSSYWATDDGVSFAVQSAPSGVAFGNSTFGLGSFYASDNSGAVPTNKIHKSSTGLTGSWQTFTLPETIQRAARIAENSAAVLALGTFAFDGIGNKAALTLDGNSWQMTGACGNAQLQPRAVKGNGRRFIASGPTTAPPYTNNKIYILDIP